MLDQFRIILVNTSHTGNIGSVARAMKTMGLNLLFCQVQSNGVKNLFILLET